MRRTQKNHTFKSPVFIGNDKNNERPSYKISTQSCLEQDNTIFGMIDLSATPKQDKISDSSKCMTPCKVFLNVSSMIANFCCFRVQYTAKR